MKNKFKVGQLVTIKLGSTVWVARIAQDFADGYYGLKYSDAWSGRVHSDGLKLISKAKAVLVQMKYKGL